MASRGTVNQLSLLSRSSCPWVLLNACCPQHQSTNVWYRVPDCLILYNILHILLIWLCHDIFLEYHNVHQNIEYEKYGHAQSNENFIFNTHIGYTKIYWNPCLANQKTAHASAKQCYPAWWKGRQCCSL